MDECVPRKLKGELPGHDVRTVNEMEWSGIKNGAHLLLAAQEFDMFLTVDQGVEFQQNLVAINLSIIVMAARTNDIDDLRPLMPRVREAVGKSVSRNGRQDSNIAIVHRQTIAGVIIGFEQIALLEQSILAVLNFTPISS